MRASNLLAAALVAAALLPAAPLRSDERASPPYTQAQAADGKALYAVHCAKCHGAELQAGSAPELVGSAFTNSKLSFRALYSEVTQYMPLDAPGSLSKSEYASVIAYVLAANCYPSGSTMLPADGAIAEPTQKIATQGGTKGCLPLKDLVP